MPEHGAYKDSKKLERQMASLYVLSTGRQQCAPGYGWGPGVRDHYLLHLILSGTGTYTVGGAADRIEKYGYPSNGQWPDMTRIKKLLGPSVPSMLANEEIQEKTRTMLYTVLDQEIDKRINKAIRQSA